MKYDPTLNPTRLNWGLRVLNKLPNSKMYRLQPIRGILHWTVDTPGRFISQKLTGTKYDFPVLRIIATLAISMEANKIYQFYADKELDRKRKNFTDLEARRIDELIENDFRFHEIRNALAQEKITREQARNEARTLVGLLTDYFSYMESKFELDDKETAREKLKSHPLFNHIRKVSEEGIRPTPGYEILRKHSKLKDSEIDLVYASLHRMHLLQRLTFDWISNTSVIEDAEKIDPDLKKGLDDIKNDAFRKSLIDFRDQGLITNSQLIYRLQEDLFWQSKFEIWHILGVQRLKRTDSGWSNDILHLDDIHEETLAEILEAKRTQ